MSVLTILCLPCNIKSQIIKTHKNEEFNFNLLYFAF